MVVKREREREKEREREREREKESGGGQTDRETDMQIDRQRQKIDRQIPKGWKNKCARQRQKQMQTRRQSETDYFKEELTEKEADT